MEVNNLCMGCMKPMYSPNSRCEFCGFQEDLNQSAPHHLWPRTICNGKYLIGKVIGEGGFGITYLGLDINLDLKVAIKEYYPIGFVTRDVSYGNRVFALKGDCEAYFQSGIERFLNEAKSLAKFINLPGIVMVKDFFLENGTAYIVMEFLEGMNLKNYLLKQGGTLKVEQILTMIKPVIQSLIEVHKEGIIHRDISPENIMLLENGKIKLLDFGAARDMSSGGEKSMSVFVKPGYAPEEQYRVHGQQGPWTDTYALCATLYKCITGITPAEPMDRIRSDSLKSPRSIGININPSIEKVLLKGLSLYPEERYQTMEALFEKLYGSPVKIDVETANRIREMKRKERMKDKKVNEGKEPIVWKFPEQGNNIRPAAASAEYREAQGSQTQPIQKSPMAYAYPYRNEDDIKTQALSITAQDVTLEEEDYQRDFIVQRPPVSRHNSIIKEVNQSKASVETSSLYSKRNDSTLRSSSKGLNNELRRVPRELESLKEEINNKQEQQPNAPVRHRVIVHEAPTNAKGKPIKYKTKKPAKGGSKKGLVLLVLIVAIGLGIYWYLNYYESDKGVETVSGNADSIYGCWTANLNYLSSVVTSENAIFFIDPESLTLKRLTKNANAELTKEENDQTEDTIISMTTEQVAFLNYSGGYVYYQNIDDNYRLYRISEDGSKREKIVDDEVWFPTVYGKWVYYINQDSRLYKVLNHGGDVTQIGDTVATTMCVSGEEIYYTNAGEEDALYRISTDGTSNSLILEERVDTFIVINKFIYYTVAGEERLKRYDIAKKNKSTYEDVKATIFNGGIATIYFSNEEGLFMLNLLDNTIKSVDNSKEIMGIYLIGDNVYVMDEYRKLYLLNTDENVLQAFPQ